MKGLLPLLALMVASTWSWADAIDDYVQGEMQRQRIPGLALGVMRDGVLIRAQGYGYANLEHGVPVHPDTVFQSGSIGKQFTAVAVMLLVEDGKLRLDESIRTYLPQAPASWAPITTRHLLTHTSGLYGDPGTDLRKDYTDEELLKLLFGVPRDFTPGQRWSYSNTGYVLLGLLVKQVGGASYIDVLEKRVFAPLNMQTAGLIDDRGLVLNRAAGYEVRDDGTILNQEWVSPTSNSTADGSLYLTVLDYAKWEAGLIAGRILEPESWAEVFRPVRLASGKTHPYGFGWSLATRAGQGVQQHGGSWQGFQTFFIRYLGDRLAVIALSNSRNGDPQAIARGVAALINPQLAPPAGEPIHDREPKVTQRLRRILAQNEIPADEHAAFDPRQLSSHLAAYRTRRGPFGKLTELRLFGAEERGDDRCYRYRARFEKGLLDVVLVLTPQGAIQRLSLPSVASWNAPVPE